jgi:hypothetical protein
LHTADNQLVIIRQITDLDHNCDANEHQHNFSFNKAANNVINHQSLHIGSFNKLPSSSMIGKLPEVVHNLACYQLNCPQLGKQLLLVQLCCTRPKLTEFHLRAVRIVRHQRNKFRQSKIFKLTYAFYRLMSFVPAKRNASRIDLEYCGNITETTTNSQFGMSGVVCFSIRSFQHSILPTASW